MVHLGRATVYLEVALSQRLQRIIDDTDAEFSRLDAYVRPIAYAGFESKTGQSVAQWKDTANALPVVLAKMRASDETAEALFHASFPYLREWLSNLTAYYDEAPAEMASLAEDSAVLSDVAFYSPQRATSVRFLAAALERLATRSE